MNIPRKNLTPQAQEQIRRKMQRTVSRIGLFTFLGGLAVILLGYVLQNQLHVATQVAVLVVVIGVVVIFTLNMFFMRKALDEAGVDLKTGKK